MTFPGSPLPHREWLAEGGSMGEGKEYGGGEMEGGGGSLQLRREGGRGELEGVEGEGSRGR